MLGAAPSIANGLISGIDNIPPLLRAGRAGARRQGLHAVPPRRSCRPRCPAFVGGLKQGWAFAWRSLMAGELLVIIAGQPSHRRAACRTHATSATPPALIATMIVILVVGIVVDAVFFAGIERTIRRRRGLLVR